MALLPAQPRLSSLNHPLRRPLFVFLALVLPSSARTKDHLLATTSRASLGIFQLKEAAAPAPYDYRCWDLKARYQVAPICGPPAGVPLHRWTWRLPGCAAVEGIDALVAAAKGLRRSALVPRGAIPTLLIFGHSFSRQLYESLICRYTPLIRQGFLALAGDHGPSYLSLEELRRANGTCHGYCTKDLQKFFPAASYPPNGYMPPVSHDCCHDTGTCMDFAAPIEDGSPAPRHARPMLRVCFQYAFRTPFNTPLWAFTGNMERPGAVPMEPSQVYTAAVITTAREEQLRKMLRGARIPSAEKIVVLPMGVAEGPAVKSLIEAYSHLNASAKVTGAHFRAYPRGCNMKDVHFAMPGVPDFAVDGLLRILASSFRGIEGEFSEADARLIGDTEEAGTAELTAEFGKNLSEIVPGGLGSQ